MKNNSRNSSKLNSGLAVVVRPPKKESKRKAKRKKAQAAALDQRSETVRAPDPPARLICIDVNKDQGGLDTFKKLLAELGPLKKTWRTVKGNGRERRYFSALPFLIPQDTNGEILGPGVSILPTGFQNVTGPNRSTPRAGFTWAKGRSPTEIKLEKLSPAWVQRIGERIVSAVNANVVRAPTSGGSTISGDAGRGFAEQVLQRFYAGGKHLIALGDEFMSFREEGVWRPLGRQILEQRILDVLPSTPDARQGKHATIKREVADLLFAMQARDDDPFRRQSDPMRVINCRNGEVWLLDNGDVDFRQHSATSYLEHQVKIDYDPDATCPLYDQALRGIFAKALFPNIMIRHWHELVGYIIQPQRDHALVLILFGDGNNGKTRLIQTVERLLGNDLVSTGRVEEVNIPRQSRGL
jgi:D5 N terminal like